MKAKKPIVDDRNDAPEPKEDNPFRRQEHFFSRRFGHLGFVPKGLRSVQIGEVRRGRALRDRDEGPRPGVLLSPPLAGACNWTPVGAGPVLFFTATAFSGRATAIAFDSTDPAVIFLGTSNGGVWKTTDAGASWLPKSDFARSLAIGALAIDPRDPRRIFAGTGEYGGGYGQYYGNGILASDDGGETWAEYATDTFDRDEISRLQFDPTDATSRRMYLSSGTGIYESLDGGMSWHVLRGGQASDLVLVPIGADLQLIGAFVSEGLWTATRAAGAWSTWMPIFDAALPTLSLRIALGQSRNHPRTIYAAFGDGGSIQGIAMTTTAGATWTRVTPPVSPSIDATSTFVGVPSHTHSVTVSDTALSAGAGRTLTTDPASSGPTHSHTITLSAAQMSLLAEGRGSVFVGTDLDATGHSHSFTLDRRISWQTTFNLFVSPHPDDPTIVFYGEVRLWKTTTGDGPWTDVRNVHPDNHAFGFEPGNPNHVWVCCDGGVFRSLDGGTTWEHRNFGLATLEHNSIAHHPQWETILLGGTQDNGTLRYTGSPVWETVQVGDGGFAVIDPETPSRMYQSNFYSRFYRSDDSGRPLSWRLKGAGIVGSAEFVAPFVLDPSDSNVCYFGGAALWRSPDNADTWSAVTVPLGSNINAIAIHPSDATTIYVATIRGRVHFVRRTGPTWSVPDVTTTDITGPDLPPGVCLSDLLVGPDGAVWVTVSSLSLTEGAGEFTNDHIFRLVPPSATWQSRSMGLARANPINTIVIDPMDSNRMFCGGDVAVFRTEDGGGMWEPWDQGLPNTAVIDLAIHPTLRLLRAATYGRSIWERPIDLPICPMVDLYMRDNIVDSGRVQPTPRDVPHPLDSAIWLGHWQSEDIKVDGPEPDFQTATPVTDCVGFARIEHRSVRRGRTNRFYVQVHNRGVNMAHNVRVRAFFAAAAAGLPRLPADFWSGGRPFVGDPSGPDWTPVGPTIVLGDLAPAVPGIAEWDWEVPATAPAQSCLVALATCDEDALAETDAFDADTLVANSKLVTCMNLNVVDAVPGAPMPAALIIDMHAASKAPLVDVRFQWGTLPRGARIVVAFGLDPNQRPAVQAKPEELKRHGVSLSLKDAALLPARTPPRRGQTVSIDRQHVYSLERGRNGMTTIPSVRVPLKRPLTLALNVVLPASAKAIAQFDVVQLTGKQMIGGVTYRLRPKRAPH